MYHIQFDLDPSNILQGHVTILLFKVQVEGVHCNMKWEGNCNSHGFSEAKESIRIYSGLFLYMLALSTFGVKYKSTCMYHICSFF